MNEKISGNTYTLHNQVEIPCVGFGTWQVPDGETAANAVMHAIEAGYTHIDTAIVYHNEIGVGAGIRMSGAAREKLFVTSKLWNDVRGYDETLKEFGNSLKRLNMDYLDLFLIHWPRPIAFRDNYEEANRETWRAFEHLLNEGYVRAISYQHRSRGIKESTACRTDTGSSPKAKQFKEIGQSGSSGIIYWYSFS